MVRRAKRWLASASGPSLAFLAVCIAILGLLSKSGGTQGGSAQGVSTLLLYLLIVVGAIAWLLQTQFEYQRRTHDSTLALKYTDDWLGSKNQRSDAAKILRDNKGKLANVTGNEALLDPIDDVLDILEDLGFYLQGDQISPEVAHHFFYHWIRGYWCAAQPYIKARQSEEAGLWNHLKLLYDETSAIESSVERQPRENLHLSEAKVDEFLDEEIRYAPKN